MDVSLAAISAGIGALSAGGVAYLVWLTWRRDDDAFARSMAELLELTSPSNRWPPDGSESDGRVIQPPLQGAPVSSIVSSPDRFGGFSLGQLDGAAVQNQGGPVSFIHPIERSGDAVPVSHHRDRPVLFLVASK